MYPAFIPCALSKSVRVDSARVFLVHTRGVKSSRNVRPVSGSPSRPRLEQNPPAMWAAATFAIAILRSLMALFRRREEQAVVELALRRQLAICAHRHPKPPLSSLDRAFWVVL